ncbi:hypothetical protein [uncultured Clostridium sp.]|uniref:hypothetical protein n=1 Tax=uncultured Clostridium sp. TaxID=59620 RepID=UPI0025E90BA7|nr:hypothetical protein [uncultured Clostridium sp.]
MLKKGSQKEYFYETAADPFTIYKIVPDYNLTNNNNIALVNVFSSIYKTPRQRFSFNKGYELPNQVYFDIVFKKKQANFYISVKEEYEELIKNKMDTIWNNAEISKVDDIDKMSFKNTEVCELILKDYNFKSLSVSRGDLYPLTNMMGILKMLNEEETVRINIAIEPTKRSNWVDIAKDEYKQYESGKIVNNDGNKKDELIKLGFTGAEAIVNLYIEMRLLLLESVLGIISSDKEEDKININLKIDSLEEIKKANKYSGLSSETNYKMISEVFKVRISILSSSLDNSRAKFNMLSVANSYKDLNSDNSLVVKLLSKKEQENLFNDVMENYIKPSKHCILSDKEVSKLIQLPQKDLQNEYKIQSIDTREIDIPEQLKDGLVRIGIAEKQGKKITTYWSKDKNVMALAKVFIGPQNSGKTTAVKRTVKDCYKAGYSNIVIDFIENCQTSKEIEEVIDTKDKIILELGNKDYIPALAYNEVSNLITENMDSWDRINYANLISEQVEYLINAITDTGTGELTAPMIRYLHAASMITFIKPGATINDVFLVLRRWDKRNEAIRYAKYSGCFEKDDDIFYDLEELHERDKEGKIIGTRENLIIGILNRIVILQKNPFIKAMLGAEINKDDNLTKWIEEGKSIFIHIPQTKFPNQNTRDILTTFFISRIWLAVQLRENNKDARLCNVIFDEVHQVPTTARFLSNHITEFRRHRLGLILSCHYLKQMRELLIALKSSGASYVLIAGTEKENLETLREEILPFTIEEGMKLKPHTSINVANYGNQYAKFITSLPKF